MWDVRTSERLLWEKSHQSYYYVQICNGLRSQDTRNMFQRTIRPDEVEFFSQPEEVEFHRAEFNTDCKTAIHYIYIHNPLKVPHLYQCTEHETSLNCDVFIRKQQQCWKSLRQFHFSSLQYNTDLVSVAKTTPLDDVLKNKKKTKQA